MDEWSYIFNNNYSCGHRGLAARKSQQNKGSELTYIQTGLQVSWSVQHTLETHRFDITYISIVEKISRCPTSTIQKAPNHDTELLAHDHANDGTHWMDATVLTC